MQWIRLFYSISFVIQLDPFSNATSSPNSSMYTVLNFHIHMVECVWLMLYYLSESSANRQLHTSQIIKYDMPNAQNSEFGEMRRNDEKYRDKQRTETKWKTTNEIRILTYAYIDAYTCALRILHIGKRQRREKKKPDHRSYCSSSICLIYLSLGFWANNQQKFTYILSVFIMYLKQC